MTCIAYKEGVIAGDTMIVWDGVVKTVNEVKVAKRKGHLFGLAGGNMPSLDAVVNCYFTKDRKTLKQYEFVCLVIKPSGTIHQFDNSGRLDDIQGPFFAIGSGREYAIGAMECGATSEQAVQAAIKWCPTVGGKVVVRKL